MPESTATATEDSVAEGDPQVAEPKGSALGKLAVLLLVFVVVTAECAVAYLLIPSRSETAAMAGVALAAEAAAAKADEDAEESAPDPTQVEVDLGEFGVTSYQPISNTTLRIDFRLFGTVAVEQENELLDRLERTNHRFRDEVIVTVRSSEITDLTDAGLGLIKRKILEKSNALLGKAYLKSIIFSDFSFIEQ